MSFLEPLFLAGLLAAAIPIVIHLINRRKATRQPFPAMRLLRESQKKEARSIKVRQWLLLLLRVLVVAALAFALAKPYFESEEGLTASERYPTAVVFVVDDSASMRHGDWWERAEESVEDELGELRPWDEAALITTTDPDGPLNGFRDQHDEVEEAFEEVDPGGRSADLSDGLEAAADLLSGSQLPGKRIVVVSDFARGGFPEKPQVDTKVPYQVEQVRVRGDRESNPDNLAVTDVAYEQQRSGRSRAWKIDATVENHGQSDREGVELRLGVDGKNVASGLVDVPAGESVTHTFRHHFEGTGVRRAQVALADAEPYEADDVHHFAVHLQDEVRVLVVDGEPSGTAYNDEVFFLTRALRPGSDSESLISPDVTTSGGLERREVGDYDVVVLANVSSVSDEEAGKLAGFVERGGGLFISMGDQVDTEAWNRSMKELLPKPLRNVKQLAETDDPDAPVKVARLGSGNRDHPVFRLFDMPGGSTLKSVQVFSYMLLDPSESEETREVIAFDDKAPALLERKVGDGRVMMLTTTLDREWTDFPVRTAFLPMMRRSMEYLARRASARGADRPIVGEKVHLEVSGLVDERAIVRGPDDARHVLERRDGAVEFTPPEPGFYEVWADTDEADGDDDEPKNRLDSLAFG
ncbi:MAG: BatA domain-containing protein, partial [Persicimonas sp.]